MSTFHILNGDCLAESFPSNFSENVIIWRECLVDGPVSEQNFLKNREKFISENYQIPKVNYHDKVVLELGKLQSVPENSDVYFWFGDDLFCQVNFWFLISVVKDRNLNFYRVFPSENHFEFEDFKPENIHNYLEKSKLISDSEKKKISHLWKQYQTDFSFEIFDSEMVRKFEELQLTNNNRFNGNLEKDLIQIKLETENFEAFFRKFQQEFPIYGFGDLQVLQLWKKL